MSFSFRNIFSPDENGFGGAPSGFDQPGFATGEGTGRKALELESPPAAGAGQNFLVSELIAFIPPAISAQSGIPMMRELRIPLPLDGSRDVKLSTIYQICPELFAAEITPLNDSTVTLPPKLGAMEASPALESPFWSQTPSKVKESYSSAAAAGIHDELVRSDLQELAAWSKRPTGGAKPFASSQAEVAGPTKRSPFESRASVANEMKEAGDFGMPAGITPTGTTPDDWGSGFPGGFVGFEAKPLSGLFGTGAAVSTAPEEIEKGSKPFPGNLYESEEEFKTLFTKHAEADKYLPYPKSSSPGTATIPAEEPEGVWGAMFQGGGFSDTEEAMTNAPFSSAVGESIGNLLSETVSARPASAAAGFQKAGAALQPFIAPAMTPPTFAHRIPMGVSPFEAVSDSDPDSISGFAPAALPVAEKPAGAATQPEVFSGVEAKSESTSSPKHVSADAASFDDLISALASTPAESTPPLPTAAIPRDVTESAPVRLAHEAHPETATDLRDLELRAIFSTSESFSLSMVARRVVGLPGIVNCSLSTPGKLVQASRSDGGYHSSEVREMVATLRSLSKLTGLPDARIFTLQTDRGIVSLFLEGECCVLVLHETVAFEPGVREKLIMVARSLTHLED